ncbi:hypothetical protein ACFSHQ_05975 [Gemmobacter lanyuensis]
MQPAPDFLSARPTLFAFLDMMRDRNMLPEPKDYRSWRKQMAELEAAAASGHYEETWSLPSGQTYRLIGRPHPNGALALMFEDISNEITRIRRYRADLELGQAVLDSMDEALAVFSAAGVMVMANSRYGEIWGHDPAGSIAGARWPPSAAIGATVAPPAPSGPRLRLSAATTAATTAARMRCGVISACKTDDWCTAPSAACRAVRHWPASAWQALHCPNRLLHPPKTTVVLPDPACGGVLAAVKPLHDTKPVFALPGR